MPTVDAQIPLSVRPWQTPDYQQSLGNALSLKSAITQNQQQDQQIQQQQALRDIWKDSDTSTPQGQAALIKKVGGVNPSLVPALQKQFGDQAVQQSTIAKNNAQATEATEKTADLKAKRVADAYTAAYNEVKSDLDEYDQATKDGRLTAQVTDKITADMKALAPQFESFGIFPAEMIEKMKNGQFNEQNWRKSLPQLKAHADQATLIAQQKANFGERSELERETHDRAAEANSARLASATERRASVLEEKAAQSASASVDGALGPEELQFMARQGLKGDTTVFQNLGRGAQGAKNVIALRRAMLAEAKAQGISPEQVAQTNAEFFGLKAGERTLGTKEANVSMAINEASNMMPIVQDASKKFARTNFPLANKAIAAAEEGTGDPNVVAYGAALNSFVNAYSRAVSPSGVPTVTDKEHAREILNRAHSDEQLNAALKVMQQEMDAAKRAPKQSKQELRDLSGGAEGDKHADTKTLHWDDLK